MLSEVASSWKPSTIGALGRWAGGGTPSKGNAAYWFAGTIPWVSPKDMKSSTITATEDYITEIAVEESSTRVVPTGSVLIVTRSGILRHTFPVAKAGLSLAINQDIKALVPGQGIDWDFAFSLVQANSEEILKTCTKIGTTVESVDFESLKQLPIALPPLPEQRKIAEILGSVDEAIRATEAVIAQTRRVKEGLLQELLTKGIGHTRFKQTPIGEIPEGWEVKRLGDVTRVIDCKHRTPAYSDKGFPVVRPGDVTGGPLNLESCLKVVKEEFDDLNEKHRPGVGDIVYSRNQNYGIASLIETDDEFAIGQDVCIIQPVELQPAFLCFALSSEIVWFQIRKIMAGSTFKRINLGDIRKFWVPVPPHAEQIAVAEKLRSFEGALQAARQESQKLGDTKKGLLQDLLTGKVRVDF